MNFPVMIKWCRKVMLCLSPCKKILVRFVLMQQHIRILLTGKIGVSRLCSPGTVKKFLLMSNWLLNQKPVWGDFTIVSRHTHTHKLWIPSTLTVQVYFYASNFRHVKSLLDRCGCCGSLKPRGSHSSERDAVLGDVRGE